MISDTVEAADKVSKMDPSGWLVLALIVVGAVLYGLWRLINRHLARREREMTVLQQQFIKDRDALLLDYRADRARYEMSMKEMIGAQQKLIEQCLEGQHKLTTALNQSAQFISEGNKIIQQNNELIRAMAKKSGGE